jgi:CcmD family protein
MNMRSLVFGLLLISALTFGGGARAEEASPDATAAGQADESPADERAAQFVGVTGPEAESVPGGALLLAAYAIVWVLLFLFLARLRRLQSQTAEELERLSAEMKASGGR